MRSGYLLTAIIEVFQALILSTLEGLMAESAQG